METYAFAFVIAAFILPAAAGCGSSGNPTTIILSSGERTSITTPNYPSDYPSGQTCYWRIMAPVGRTVGFWFNTDFRLESSVFDCDDDYVSLYDGSSTYARIGQYCGRSNPDPGKTSGRYLYVKFHSDRVFEYKGFRMNLAEGGYYPGHDTTDTGLIIGIVVAVVIFLIIVAACVGCIYCCSSGHRQGSVIRSGGTTVVVQNRASPQVAPSYQPQPSPGFYQPPPPPGHYPLSPGPYPQPSAPEQYPGSYSNPAGPPQYDALYPPPQPSPY